MDDVQILLARERIKELKARYFRVTDAHDYDAFRELFTEDAIFESGDNGMPASARMAGRDEIVAGTKAASAGAIKIHHGHNCEISFPSAGRAKGIWCAEYRFFEGEPRKLTRHAFVYYYEDYVEVAGEWKISHLVLSHVYSII
jgi:hypothetical protein